MSFGWQVRLGVCTLALGVSRSESVRLAHKGWPVGASAPGEPRGSDKPLLLGVLAGCSVVRVVARLSSSSLEMNGAREPCSEGKFQSHPTVPPGRLNELAFAAVYRGEECSVNFSGELNPMISPTESSRVAACESMGLPHLIVALGAPSRLRQDVWDGPAAASVT